MPSTPLIAFSSGAATVCSSTLAEAPGYTAVTLTTGGAISGYCAIGSTRIEASPASTMKIDSTAAKIGRSMKKRENIGGSLSRDRRRLARHSRAGGAPEPRAGQITGSPRGRG